VVDERDKWNRIHSAAAQSAAEPARVLRNFEHLLPGTGAALDLACGRGGNALFLAARGLATQAWDISDIACAQLAAAALRQGLTLDCVVRDVVAHPPDPESFDVIAVSHFLDRSICMPLQQALRRDGILFYQTFIEAAVDAGGPRNPAYRLQANELLRLFAGLQVIAYREEARRGDTARGFRNEAMLVAARTRGRT